MDEIIIGEPVQTPEKQYDMAKDINVKLQHALNSGSLTGGAMWGGAVPQDIYRDVPVKEEGKRVIVRPKART
jgi:hypothetical protein